MADYEGKPVSRNAGKATVNQTRAGNVTTVVTEGNEQQESHGNVTNFPHENEFNSKLERFVLPN